VSRTISTRRFGTFEINLRARELRKHGIRVRLSGQPFEILSLFLEKPGEIITREEFRSRLWPGDTFVDFEHSLNTAIKKLRSTLGDTPENSRYIETVPRVGYRFVAPVDTIEAPAPEIAASAIRPSYAVEKTKQRPFFPRYPRASVLASVVALLTLSRYLVWQYLQPPRLSNPGRIMLVVLPFQNLTGVPEESYFSDGLTEEMITQLGGLQPNRLGVISRTSAMRFKRGDKSVEQIGRELGVQYVLEGSVRSDADRVRISAQLTRVSDQSHIWTRSYEQDRRDALTVESQIARDIADAVELQLTPDQQRRLASAHTVNADAYEDYLKGCSMYMQHTPPDFERAIKYFQRSIEKDPNYALAYSELADSFILLSTFGLTSQQETMPKARVAAQKAMEIDPTLAEPHASLALIAQNYDWDWREAEHQYRQAIELNPNYAPAHHWYASGYLTIMGRFDDAVAELGKARELDPLSLPIRTALAKVFLLSGQYTQGIQELKNILEVRPNSPVAHNLLGWAFLETGKSGEAHIEFMTAVKLADTPGNQADIGVYYARTGNRRNAEEVLTQLRKRRRSSYVSPVAFAEIYTALGRKNEAFEAFRKAYSGRTMEMVSLKVDTQFASLHTDARYAELVHQIGLPPLNACSRCPENKGRLSIADIPKQNAGKKEGRRVGCLEDGPGPPVSLISFAQSRQCSGPPCHPCPGPCPGRGSCAD
jgi:TolB-like protein/DNA-binding winged helix-turn-helix (wHTH) protein/Tfp pilus assembly protein PilF